MGGKGSGANPYGTGNYEMGFSSYTPGGTPGWDPNHPEAAYAQAGWDAAASQYEQQTLIDTMITDLMDSISGTGSYAPQTVVEPYSSESVFTNPNATYQDLVAADIKARPGAEDPEREYGPNFGFVWDPNREFENTTGGWDFISNVELSSLASDRTGTMENYGGLLGADTNYFEDWNTAIKGENARDDLFAQRTTAATQATDLVTEAIGREASNAALLGIDYGITDESKQQRINDQFANLWTDEQQNDLTGLMDKWGTPEGFEGFSVTRGVAPSGQGDTTTTTTSASSAPANTGTGSYLEDEDVLLGDSNNLLGV